MQLKHCNYAAFSHFHGCAVNNLGLVLLSCLMERMGHKWAMRRKITSRMLPSCYFEVLSPDAEWASCARDTALAKVSAICRCTCSGVSSKPYLIH